MFLLSRFWRYNLRIHGFRVFSNFSENPTLPPTSFFPEKYKGDSYDNVLQIRNINYNKWSNTLYKQPLMITQGCMQYVWDQNGKRYLDMFAGIVTISVGHCHPKIVKAAVDQMNKLWHLTNIYLHPNLSEFAKKLTSYFPKELNVCYFCNSGSEANDMALLISRIATGAFDVLCLRDAYHGDSPYTVGLCGLGSWKHNVANGFGIHYVMNPDPYRGLWGGANCRDSPVQTEKTCSCKLECEATDMYINQLEETLSSLPKNIAAFFSESIQGVGGSVQYPKNYLKKAYDIIRNRGGLCIADEVQTGFGRTGKFWGFQNEDVVPDIVTMAKGIGNGFPLAAVVTTNEIAERANKALMFNTFGGNPVACAVGSAVLDVIKEENLMENCQTVGTHLLKGLEKLRSKYEIVGDVRGKGLMVGVELVTDKNSRTPIPNSIMNEIMEDTKDMGLLIGVGGRYKSVFRIKPPMCITQEDADFCIAVLDKALSKHS